jgi:nucleoid-associated protein YgaU
MTSDAKIGLLLGLVFIFIIAFIINGLPSLHGKNANNSELTTNMVSSQNGHLGLAAKEHKGQQTLQQTEPPQRQVAKTGGISVPASANASEEIPAAADNVVSPPAVSNKPVETKPQEVAETPATGDENPSVAVEQKQQQAPQPKPDETVAKNAYVVCEGDSLVTIAKKFYGSAEGNKRANILKIFEANKKALRSPDELEVGQTLTIPPLPAAPATTAVSKEKPESVLTAKTPKNSEPAVQKALPAADSHKTKQNGHSYTVREGDNLWRIAAEQLGDGNRYPEIVRLNPNLLNDEDGLAVGMRLKMPAQ